MKEKLSAWMDGQLEAPGATDVCEAVLEDDELRSNWDCYCLLGDVLRGESHETDLTDRVMARIVSEPPIAAPVHPLPVHIKAANESRFSRFVPLAASVAGVAAVAWIVMATQVPRNLPDTTFSSVAAVPSRFAPVAASAIPQDAEEQRRREYVMAHQGMVAGGPIPGVVQYVRTVSDLRGGSDR